jgi:hypothetical protein
MLKFTITNSNSSQKPQFITQSFFSNLNTISNYGFDVMSYEIIKKYRSISDSGVFRITYKNK